MANLNFSNRSPRNINIDLAATISPRAEGQDSNLNFCQKLPVSLVFNMAPTAASATPIEYDCDLVGQLTIGGEFAAQAGVQGSFTANVALTPSVFACAWDVKVWRGLNKKTCAVSEQTIPLFDAMWSGWVDSERYKLGKDIVWEEAQDLTKEVHSTIGNLTSFNHERSFPWQTATQYWMSHTASYVWCWPVNNFVGTKYQDGSSRNNIWCDLFVECWPRNITRCAPYQPAQLLQTDYDVFWQKALHYVNNTCTGWEKTQEPELLWPLPLNPTPEIPPLFEGEVDFNLTCLLPDPIWGGVLFNLGIENVCLQSLPVGWVPPGYVPRRVIIVTHELYIKLLSDDSLLPCTQVGVSIDRDSWGWSWTATLPERRPELLTAQHSVEISIDTYKWRGIIENMSGSRQFGQTGYSIGGRSLAAALSAPFSAPDNHVEATQKTAAQLATQELPATGWTLAWNAVDWLIPAGCFTYTNTTPLGAIKLLAAGVDAIVTSEKVNQNLIIHPRYKASPWALGAVTPDAIIPLDTVLGESVQWQPSTLNLGVWVSGQSHGQRVHVTRAGTSGAPDAAMIVSPLITTVAAATERGRSVLAGTGSRRDVSLQMPLLSSLGVFTPGDIVEVLDTPSFRGYIDSVKIDATPSQVTQSVTIEHVYDFEE